MPQLRLHSWLIEASMRTRGIWGHQAKHPDDTFATGGLSSPRAIRECPVIAVASSILAQQRLDPQETHWFEAELLPELKQVGEMRRYSQMVNITRIAMITR